MAEHASTVKKTGKYALPQRWYEITKYLAQIVLPAAITLYTTLASAWEWGNVEATVITLGAVNVFLGAVLKLSTVSYNNAEMQYDGSINLIPEGAAYEDPVTGRQRVDMIPKNFVMDLTPNQMASKDEVLIKINKEDPEV